MPNSNNNSVPMEPPRLSLEQVHRLERYLEDPCWKDLLGEFDDRWTRAQRAIRNHRLSKKDHAFFCGQIKVLDFLYSFSDHLKEVREVWAAIESSRKTSDAAELAQRENERS